MKLQYWVAIAAASALWGPACVWAQGVQGGPTAPIPQTAPSRPDGAGSFLPDIDPALPNRRVPGLAPPDPGNIHPVTPDEAWPKPPPSRKPALPSGKPGIDSATPTQPLNGTGSEGFQHPPRTGK